MRIASYYTADRRPVKSKRRAVKSGPDATDGEDFCCLVRATCSDFAGDGAREGDSKETKNAPQQEKPAASTGGAGSSEKRKKRKKKRRRSDGHGSSSLTRISTLIWQRDVARFTGSLTALQKAAMGTADGDDDGAGGGMKRKEKKKRT